LSIGHLPIDMEVMTSPAVAEPGVFGVRRPILLLPAGIVDQLTPPQLEAILAHELCHVRRRDNLATAIHMAVEAMFWFHPLVWWLGARLMEERERACDEDVLLGSEPQVYAEGILKICELYLESPVPCVSGVTGANLKKRIEAIMSNRTVLKLNFAQKVALAAAGMAALAAPIVVGVLNAPAIRAQSPQAAAQSAAVTAKFEVASIKPCSVEDGGGGGGRGKGGGRGSGGISWSPGRFHWECGSVYYFIATRTSPTRKANLGPPPHVRNRLRPREISRTVAVQGAAAGFLPSPTGSSGSRSREARTGSIPIATLSTPKPMARQAPR
jgi:hypothetical protein